jgi:sarcosine oxidase, subunit alpha
MTMIGHVTSSYYSAALGHSIALALVKGGRNRIGETVYVPLDNKTIACEVVAPGFYDMDGSRMNG